MKYRIFSMMFTIVLTQSTACQPKYPKSSLPSGPTLTDQSSVKLLKPHLCFCISSRSSCKDGLKHTFHSILRCSKLLTKIYEYSILTALKRTYSTFSIFPCWCACYKIYHIHWTNNMTCLKKLQYFRITVFHIRICKSRYGPHM